MNLLHGQAASDAVRSMLASPEPIVAVSVDPEARAGKPIAVLGLATTDRSVLVAPDSSDCLNQLNQTEKPLAAYDAKPIHHAIFQATHAGPKRWACIRLSEQLIAGGRPSDTELRAIGQRHDVADVPDLADGFAAMAKHTQALALIIEAQSLALRGADMTRASKLEARAVAPIAEMEIHGVPFDKALWQSLAHAHETERTALKHKLDGHFAFATRRDLAGHVPLNIDSEQELKAGLQALGFHVPNLRQRTLQALPSPLGDHLRRYRQLGKLVAAYGSAFLQHVGPDERIHPTFEQIGASTGRMACRAPNLQAMVASDEHRRCFRAKAERVLVIADYATCELRILAEMSGDPVFLDAFLANEDVHARVATSVFGEPVSKTQRPDLRHRAKSVNFGLVYGMGALGLAKTLGTTEDQARDILQKYFRTFPRIRDFLEDISRLSLSRGYAQTLSGRRLYLDDVAFDRGQAERIAKNMPIQGTSADITKIALARLRERLADMKTHVSPPHIINVVHDEILVECAVDDSEAVAGVVRQAMEEAGRDLLHRVPLAVDVYVSQVWQK